MRWPRTTAVDSQPTSEPACLFFFFFKKKRVQRYKVSAMAKDAKSHVARATVTTRRQKKKRKCSERTSLKGRLKHNLAGHKIVPRMHRMQKLKTKLAGHMINQTHSRGCSLLLIIMLRDRIVTFSSGDQEISFQVPSNGVDMHVYRGWVKG